MGAQCKAPQGAQGVLDRATRPADVPVALLAEGDGDTRQMYATFLRMSAFAIEEAADGREALAKALSRRPDVIVTDTQIAGIDGFELCRLLRSDTTTCDIPIVVITADAFPRDLRRATAAGADAVLTKPCPPGDLSTELQRLLRESRLLGHGSRSVRSKAQPLRYLRSHIGRLRCVG